jgi:hypothetical protein
MMRINARVVKRQKTNKTALHTENPHETGFFSKEEVFQFAIYLQENDGNVFFSYYRSISLEWLFSCRFSRFNLARPWPLL